MTWEIERDENGEAVRMWWRGPDEETFGELLQAELSRCAECAYPNGWHKRSCSRLSSDSTAEPT